jgi:hypothetical protein
MTYYRGLREFVNYRTRYSHHPTISSEEGGGFNGRGNEQKAKSAQSYSFKSDGEVFGIKDNTYKE